MLQGDSLASLIDQRLIASNDALCKLLGGSQHQLGSIEGGNKLQQQAGFQIGILEGDLGELRRCRLKEACNALRAWCHFSCLLLTLLSGND